MIHRDSSTFTRRTVQNGHQGLGRITAPQLERPFATAEEVDRTTRRLSPAHATLVGLQWSRVDLNQARIPITRTDGALHELGGRLELGWTPIKPGMHSMTCVTPTKLGSSRTSYPRSCIYSHVQRLLDLTVVKIACRRLFPQTAERPID
ncbi:hypothetical protein L3Q67_24660 [Saccharothrix sp. AJ9571]|nr:hypothetical protein L3Q67_24660 [Saccharothrix sp. AJ9571]